jgi:hypothetical protein
MFFYWQKLAFTFYEGSERYPGGCLQGWMDGLVLFCTAIAIETFLFLYLFDCLCRLLHIYIIFSYYLIYTVA